MSPVRAAAVIPAGGSGSRMRGGSGSEAAPAKQFALLAGEPVLQRSLRPFLSHGSFDWVVVPLPEDALASPPDYLLHPAILPVRGGATRGESVLAGVEAVPDEADVVLVHDAARPLLSDALLDRVLRAVTSESGAIAAVPVADTLKRVAADGRITATVPREGLWRAQTPQGFPRALLLDACRRAAGEGFSGTDEAALVERLGGRVTVVEGDPRNLKITRPGDLALAEALLRDGSR